MDSFNEKLLDQIPDGLAAFDLEGRFIFWNQTLQNLTGLAESSVLGKKFFELFPDFKVKNQDFHVREAFAGRSALAHHFPFGEIQYPQLSFETFYGPLKNEAGKVTGGVALVRDLSVRMKELRLLEDREKRLRQFFEIAEEAIMIHDQGVIQDVNPALARMLGYLPEEMIGRPVSDFSDPVSAKKTQTYLAVGYPEGTYEYLAKRKDGTTFPIEVRGRDFEVGGKTLRVSTGWDITDRKKIEQAIQESEERFKRFTEIAREGILLHKKGEILDVNPALLNLIGLSESEVIGRNTLDFLTPESAALARKFRDEGFPAEPYEVTLRHQDGTLIPAETLGRYLTVNGEEIRVIGVWDIRDRKKAEDALRRSEEKFRSLIENSYDLITVLDRDGKRIYESPSLERVLGFKPGEREGLTFDTQPPEDREKGRAVFREALANPGIPIRAQLKALRKDGAIIDGDMVLTNLLDDPAVGGVVVNGRDVTERKTAEEALKRSEENFRTLIERAPEAIFVHEGLKILYANPRFVELLEYQNQGQILGSAPLAHIRSEDREKIRSRIERTQSGMQNPPMEIRVLCQNGGEKIVETVSVGVLFEGRAATMVMLRDLTEQKKAEEKVRQNEDYYRALLENTHDMITVVGPDGRSLYLGPGIQRVLGYSVEERLGKNAFEFIHPDDLAWAREAFAQLSQTKAHELVPFTLRMRHKDGNWKRVAGVAQNLLAHPLVKGMLINYRDVTEQVAAEAAQRQSEERFRRFAEVTQEGILIHDQGIALDANQVFADMVGLPLSKIVGQSSFAFLDEESRQQIGGYQRGGYPPSYEVRVKRKDGTTFPAEIHGRHFQWDGRDVRVISLFDITERKNTEQVLLKLERLSTIGEMAAGMAHEIRNPLAAISMAAQLMKRKQVEGMETFLQTILEQSARLEQLVKDTLDYARVEKEATVPSLSLKSALESALRLSQIQIGPSQEKVRVEWEAAPGGYAARAQSQRVQQIFINLILNAYQAMPEGGRLTLGLAEAGDKVLVRIADTGPGLPKKEFQRIFEPFFTTKGTGSGLGLAISQRIAAQYGGRITAERLKPHGMAFTLELPRAQGGPA